MWATLLFRGVWYSLPADNIADVTDIASKSRDERTAFLGEEHEEVLDSTGMLATAYWLDGRSEEAEQLQVRVMEIRKKKRRSLVTIIPTH